MLRGEKKSCLNLARKNLAFRPEPGQESYHREFFSFEKSSSCKPEEEESEPDAKTALKKTGRINCYSMQPVRNWPRDGRSFGQQYVTVGNTCVMKCTALESVYVALAQSNCMGESIEHDLAVKVLHGGIEFTHLP